MAGSVSPQLQDQRDGQQASGRLAGQAASLGPHVVGERVVVRRLVRGETGPTGGPAFTDLLGSCLSWGPTSCVVAPESGEPVEIALADIVSGKPVPPRPSVRQRVSARDAELRVVRMFPGVETEPLGEWLLRSDPAPFGRLYKRANSCLAIGSPAVGLPEAATAVRDWYAARRRDPLVQVESGSTVEAGLVDLGWRPLTDGDAEHRLGSIVRTRRALGRLDDRAVVAPESGPERALVVVPGEAGAAGPLAEGRAVLDGDWLGVHDLRVRLERRRQGLAREVMGALLEWGAERGALTVWLHVETDNVGGRAFYDALGLGVHHEVRYLVPGSA